MKDKKAIDATRIIVPKPTSKPLKSGRLSKIMAQLYLKGLKPASNMNQYLIVLMKAPGSLYKSGLKG